MRRRRLDDPALASDRSDVSAVGDDPRVPGQRALSPRRSRAGVVGAARPADHAALHPRLLPASEPDRTAVGPDAQAPDAQQILARLSRIRRGYAWLSTRQS